MSMRIDGDLTVTGSINASGSYTGPISKSNLVQETLEAFPIPLTSLRVWDAFQTNITTAAADDLGLTAGAFGTGTPYVVSRDLNALGATTGYARTLFTLPPEYVDGAAITIRFAAGMLSAVASVSATVDVEVYKVARTTLVSGSDLVTTSATSINSTTFAEYSFTVTPTSRVAGDVLDIRIALSCNSATASSHFAAIAAIEVLLTIK